MIELNLFGVDFKIYKNGDVYRRNKCTLMFKKINTNRAVNGKVHVHISTGYRQHKLFHLNKIVYYCFNKDYDYTNHAILNEIEHIDGDVTNFAIDNLKKRFE